MPSREKELQLIHNILAAFAAAPKRPVANANPATTDAWVAEVVVPGLVTVQVFRSKVNVSPWYDEEHLAAAVEVRGVGLQEFFRAKAVSGRWHVTHNSPLAWALFGLQQQQPMGETIAVAMPSTAVPVA